jgi:hypothetical protein
MASPDLCRNNINVTAAEPGRILSRFHPTALAVDDCSLGVTAARRHRDIDGIRRTSHSSRLSNHSGSLSGAPFYAYSVIMRATPPRFDGTAAYSRVFGADHGPGISAAYRDLFLQVKAQGSTFVGRGR